MNGTVQYGQHYNCCRCGRNRLIKIYLIKHRSLTPLGTESQSMSIIIACINLKTSQTVSHTAANAHESQCIPSQLLFQTEDWKWPHKTNTRWASPTAYLTFYLIFFVLYLASYVKMYEIFMVLCIWIVIYYMIF